MITKSNIITSLLSSDKFASGFLPLAGSTVLHVALFAGIFGYFGGDVDDGPRPEVIAIELVMMDAPALSKGEKTITDIDGSLSQQKQAEKNIELQKHKVMSSPSLSLEKIPAPEKTKLKKAKAQKNQKKKLASLSKPGSQRQMKGSSQNTRNHGPKFSGKGLSNPRPSYPHSARSKGQQGRVVLKVRVNSSGRPLSVHVSRSSGIKSLDNSAVRAVKRWRFYPARKNGRAVAGTVYTPITFRLVK